MTTAFPAPSGDSRQDRRLDDHGYRIRGLEQREAVTAERIELLNRSVDGLRTDVRTAIGALVVLGVGQIIMERAFGG